MDKVAGQQDLTRLAVGLKLGLADVKAETSPAQQVEDEQRRVEEHTEGGRVPDDNVAHQVDLVVGVLGDVVGNAPGEEGPLGRVAGKVVVLHVLLVGGQHLDLELKELLPEGERRLLLGDELVAVQLALDGLLVLVVLGVAVLLHVPDGVRLVDVPVRDHLGLMEAPLGILLAAVAKRMAGVDVDEPDLGVDGVPDIARLVPVHNVHRPQVLGRHGDVVVDVAGDLLVVRRHRGRHVVRVKGPVGEAVHQLDYVAVLDAVEGLLDGKVLPVRALDEPPVVDVLEGVAGDLLLVRGAPPVRIPAPPKHDSSYSVACTLIKKRRFPSVILWIC